MPKEASGKRALLYGRCSTKDKGQDPEMQMRELREFCLRRGWTIAGEYVDNGVSGAKQDRPELNRLMEDAAAGKGDVVAVWKFDRMARSVSHLLRVLETFNEGGLQFCSLSEQIDTTTPAGKMVFTVLGAVAELERSLIAERVRAGLRNARAKGKTLGRPVIAVDPEEVKRMRAQGQSWKKVASHFGVSIGRAFKALA
jgi:DNA invertase Pin-like site-specific DNA recombinase